MRRKALISLFMLFGFAVIGFGGYHCSLRAQNQYPPGHAPPPNDQGYRDHYGPRNGGGNDYDDDYDYGRDNKPRDPLPEKPDDPCRRRQYDSLKDRFGSMGFVRFSRSALRDYRLGRESNFGVGCGRIYLDMEPDSSLDDSRETVYGGELTISFEDGGEILFQQFDSGRGSDNIHNYWRGNSWRARRSSRRRDRDSDRRTVNQNFYAIFEGRDAAIILKINDVMEKDVGDGYTELLGFGEIWYKMFRDFTGDRNDKCYRKGTYMRHSGTGASKPGRRCWLVRHGPFSCKPQGVNPREDEDIDLSGSLPCYSKLGSFGSLKLRGAFNVEHDEDHP